MYSMNHTGEFLAVVAQTRGLGGFRVDYVDELHASLGHFKKIFNDSQIQKTTMHHNQIVIC